MSAVVTGMVVDAARAHAAAPRGERTAIVRQLAEHLGCSLTTAYEHLRGALQTTAQRKRRCDAGDYSLSRDEALQISALVEASRRDTATGALTLDDAVKLLRDNGRILAGRVDTRTGEFTPLSSTAISRALRHYHLHPEQLAAASPATRLSSPHPNYCWQIDASVSRQFYLASDGAKLMAQQEFYRGKPQNFERISSQRLWRYAVTDHASGYIEVFYVLGAESASNLLSALIHAMVQRSDGCMHGVPRYLMSDGGALNAAATFTFLRALGVLPIVNEAGNARAKGQVEQAHNMIERHFEAVLKLRAPVTSLQEINQLARRWARHYNATAVHSRHGMTRRDAWLRITAEQLVFAPPVEVLQQLPLSSPVTCTVRDYILQFKGKRYDVRGLPGVLNGQKVEVVLNPFDAASVRVLITGDDGRPAHYIAQEYSVDSWGFQSGAARVGTEHKAVPETPADAARKEVARIAMDADTDALADAARKAKRVPFGGRLDIGAGWEAPVVHLPRAGTPSDVVAPRIVEPTPVVPVNRPRYEPQRWAFLDSVRELKRRLEDRGGTWTADHYARAQQRWPEGLTEDEIDAAVVQLMAPALRAIAGGAA